MKLENKNEQSDSDNESTQAEKLVTEDNEIPEHMVEVINHINHIDLFILNNKYDTYGKNK